MIIPRGFTVLVKPESVEDAVKKPKDSQIIIPETVSDKERINVFKGTVVRVGNCAWHGLGHGEPWAGPGDKVLYAQFGGKFIKDVDGTEYILLQDKDIMGIYVDE